MTGRAEVREVCRQGLCKGCPGNYDIKARAGDRVPAVSGRCGHECHDPLQVTVTVLESGR